MEEMRAVIREFPDYEVTNLGRVLKPERNWEMTWSPNQNGDMTVGLTRDGHQFRRSVKTLVARAFVEGENIVFNTPVLLDADKCNLCADNMVWRPRWFAMQYARQFHTPSKWINTPGIIEIFSGIEYENILEASMANGVLCYDIYRSIHESTEHHLRKTFPTGQAFTYIR